VNCAEKHSERKNWLFLGTDDAGEVNAIFVTLLASCQLHEIEPAAYLRDLFCLLPSWPAKRVLRIDEHSAKNEQRPPPPSATRLVERIVRYGGKALARAMARRNEVLAAGEQALVKKIVAKFGEDVTFEKG
jgi:hypothetical protein